MDTEDSLARGRKRIIIGSIATIIVLILAIIVSIKLPKWIFDYKCKYVFGVDAQKTIENSLELTLPDTAEIVNYEYDRDTTYYYAKVKLEDTSLDDIKSELIEFIGKEIDKSQYTANADNEWWIEKSKENFDTYCWDVNSKSIPMQQLDWWDIKPEDIQNVYYSFKSAKKNVYDMVMKTITCGAAITREEDNNYLYICTSLIASK